MSSWTTADIPSQQGRTIVVTGTGGIGFETALALAGSGAKVIIAGRNHSKGMRAVTKIREFFPNAHVSFENLDLASLESIDAFGTRFHQRQERVDVLINNAAVMAPPKREITSDGFELQFGTNFLGHFALTAKLLPLLRKSNQPRVISLSSVAARSGKIHFDDLQSAKKYKPMIAYSQSKLACLMFALELQRRSDLAGWGIQSIASHPGVARTDLIPNGAGASSLAGMVRRFLWFLFQPAAQGALPILYAATSSQAKNGGYYGPDRLSETRGYPAPANIPVQARDSNVSSQLWTESQGLTRATFL